MPEFKGFVGGAYEAPDLDQNMQEAINWYVEIDPSDEKKSVKALLGAPGRVSVASTTVGEVRGAWVLPGNQQCLWVTGSSLYLMTVNVPATATAPATFTVTSVGSLVTSTGQVCMRDNATGGIAVLVDGANGYVYNIAARTLTRITDPAFLGSDRVSFIDGWLVFNKPGSQLFYVAPVYWNGTSAMDATYFALKDSSSDNLVTHVEHMRELWLVGERTTEVWYDAGNATFPFSRIQGAVMQLGCSAKHSIARIGDGLLWLGRSERGENVVIKTRGYQYQMVSTPAIAKAIASYPVVSDAIAFVYQEDDHVFYVLTFPSADVTWVYDNSTDHWHKRASTDTATGAFHRMRANCFANFQDQRLVGDYADGSICRLTRSAYDDNGLPLKALRRTPHVWDGTDRKRVYQSSLQIQFRAGVGNSVDPGSNPQCMLRWSNDSGRTWSQERQMPIGKIGEYQNRAITRRLGQARDRVYEVSITDPVPRDIVGATLEASL